MHNIIGDVGHVALIKIKLAEKKIKHFHALVQFPKLKFFAFLQSQFVLRNALKFWAFFSFTFL